MALLSTLVDNFDTAGAIDGSKWSFSNLGLNGSAAYSGGKLVFNAGTTVAFNGECHLTSTASYDLTASAGYVRLVTTSSDPTRSITGFRVESSADATDRLDMYVDEAGTLYMLGINNGSSVVGTSITFNATTHAWWRIREAGGNVYWDTAPASSSNPPASGDWVQRYTSLTSALGWSPGSVASVKAHLYFRLTATAASAPTVEFDGFDTSSGSGSAISATFAASGGSADTFAATSTVKVAATMAAAESGADIFQATSGVRVATIALAESGADTFAASGTRGPAPSAWLPPYNPPQNTAQYIAWLKKSDSPKCLLVEADVIIAGVYTTLYMSTIGYVTQTTDSPSNKVYHSDIIGGCTVDANISLNYTTDITLGDVEVSNVNGVHDAWLGYIWHNRPIRFYLGDVRWLRADFRLVFSGICQDITSRDRNKLNIVLSDKLQRLNQSVTSNTLAGTTDNKDKLIPLCFGECSNVTPLLVNPATLEYQVHDGAIQDIVEVRDEGVPIMSNVVKDLTHGKFTLTAMPAGRVTATVQGDKFGGTYARTLSQIVNRIVTGFGVLPFNSSDIDLSNFGTFDTANPQPMGVYLQERQNILDVCNIMSAGIGSAVTENSLGLLRLVKVDVYSGGPIGFYVNESHMDAHSFEILDRVEVAPAVKVGYCRNWTIEADLQSGIPAEHKAIWADQWLTFTTANAPQAALYGLPIQPTDQVDTYLIVLNDATVEAAHRIAMWSQPRTLYGFGGFAELLLCELGDWLNITTTRFGFDTGQNVMLLGIEKDWFNCKVKMRVLI